MFIVSDLLKTTKPGKECTKLEFLSFDEDPRICVVKYLAEYLERTKNMRHDHHKLLVSYQKPHRPVSKDTVSRWLKMELKLAGKDTSTFSAHSTRAASTSAAKPRNSHLPPSWLVLVGHLKTPSQNITTKQFPNQQITLENSYSLPCKNRQFFVVRKYYCYKRYRSCLRPDCLLTQYVIIKTPVCCCHIYGRLILTVTCFQVSRDFLVT